VDEETRKALSAARIVTKGLLRTMRTHLQVLNELEKRLDQLDAEPQLGGRANGSNRNGREEFVGRK
jgi:hypothetical protein